MVGLLQNTRQRMPVLFVGHGSPMNIIADNDFTRALQREGQALPMPQAIVVISAHWEKSGTRVLQVDQPKTIYDFSGFPKELYDKAYPASGAPHIAQKVVELLGFHHAKADSSWGLDHGAWAVLHHMFPKANVPVFQLSLNKRLSLTEHLELAQSLRPLRDQGLLILASGNITHNLGQIDWNEKAEPFEWALEFDALIKAALDQRDVDELLAKKPGREALWKLAHPRREHYIPLLYAVGCSEENEAPSYPYEGFQNGSLSMRAVKFGA
jgi:4,5-DOPA dioxygenase extradiol